MNRIHRARPLTALALSTLLALVAANPAQAQSYGPGSVLPLCQYDVSGFNHQTLTACDPLAQKDRAALMRYSWTMGSLYNITEPQPYGTDKLCRYSHATYGSLTSTYCPPFNMATVYGSGWSFVEALGWLYWVGLPAPANTTELCHYQHSSGRYLTTTLCDAAAQSAHAAYNYTYWGKLGYVVASSATPFVSTGTALSGPSGSPSATLHQSATPDKSLYAHLFHAFPTEIPPTVVKLDNGSRAYVMPGSSTQRCSTPVHTDPSQYNYLERALTSESLGVNINLLTDCENVTRADVLASQSSEGYYCFEDPLESEPWRRSYNGVWKLHAVGTSERQLVGFTHGENQNLWMGANVLPGCAPNVWVQNTVKPVTTDPEDCLAPPAGYNCGGTWTGPFLAGWSEFSSFVAQVELDSYTGSWSAASPDLTEVGPVVWPKNKYSKLNAAVGPYHPTSFYDHAAGKIYLYYHTDLGFDICTKAATAAVNALGEVGPFEVKEGGITYSSLPAGFSKETTASFYNTTGREGECLFSDEINNAAGSWDHGFLSVARLRIGGQLTGCYVSVEDRIDQINGVAEVRLRVSRSPEDWSNASSVQLESSVGGFGALKYTYATLVNKSGDGHDVIDAEEFYLIGNNPNGNHTGGDTYRHSARRLRLAISAATCDLP